MDPPTSSAPPSRTAPLSSSPARRSFLSDPFSSYQDFRFRRALGHQRFPGEPNSRLRHCVVSCELALDFGIGWPRAAGVANEMQGLWLDITNLRSRLGGASSWAFQLGDFSSNERGFSRIYKSFWMNGDEIRSGSLFTYLNLYDDHGAFKLQAYWDSDARAMSYSTTREHY